MSEIRNPFEYEGAEKLRPEEILEYYVEDHNYSRFLQSKRNIFLVGDRGSGKSMALLFNSLPMRYLRSQRENKEVDLSIVCIHVPCNTPLTHKREYELLKDFEASVISEHFLAISIIHEICETLQKAKIQLEKAEEQKMREELNYLYGTKLPMESFPLWESIDVFCHKENTDAQRQLNRKDHVLYDSAMTFISGVVPFLNCVRKTKRFGNTHFSLMLDDVHDLNKYQISTVNSWVAFRDNSLFSFKIATAKTGRSDTKTSSGGNIIEGHDYTLIDMEGEYQNKYTDFGKLAKDIIEKRLRSMDISERAEDFFPVNPQLLRDLGECEEKAREEGIAKYGSVNTKAIVDYVYKYKRVLYFRRRQEKANIPTVLYTGFESLVHLSTGIIRNLLDPCYWMYDKVISEHNQESITHIPPEIQSSVIIERSKTKWDNLQNVHKAQECTSKQAEQISRLFDNLAILFKKRLLEHKSEPRAIKFIITEKVHCNYDDLLELLELAQMEQLLYTYVSSAKEFGKRTTYYVPNRILWPAKGLDPCGQHSVVSLKTSVLWDAATKNKEIPFSTEEEKEEEQKSGLFGYE